MADQKLTALTEISVPLLGDIVYYVNDPGGSPLSFKVSLKRLLGMLDPMKCDGRLSLVTGDPAFMPKPATPTSTDTTAETTTFASDPGWPTGTQVISAGTTGGLTAGTIYYVNRNSSTVYTYHTSYANALAGTPKVDLTANITQEIRPFGITGSTVYYTPYRGTQIALYDGTRWIRYSTAELSLAIGTLTSGKNYDVFLYDNAGTLTLELSAAWASATARTDALVTQDGILVKSSATTRRYIGTFQTVSTTTIEDSSRLRGLFNMYNRIKLPLLVFESTSSWTYSTATIRQANGASGNRIQVVAGWTDVPISLRVAQFTTGSVTNSGGECYIGEDSTTTPHGSCLNSRGTSSASGTATGYVGAELQTYIPLGFHAYNWLEYSEANGTSTWYGLQSSNPAVFKSGMTGLFEG